MAASKPAVPAAADPFLARLRPLVSEAPIPTVAQLNGLIDNPAGTGDLTQLALPRDAGAGAASPAPPSRS